jgi:hypothetical protein
VINDHATRGRKCHLCDDAYNGAPPFCAPCAAALQGAMQFIQIVAPQLDPPGECGGCNGDRQTGARLFRELAGRVKATGIFIPRVAVGGRAQ